MGWFARASERAASRPRHLAALGVLGLAFAIGTAGCQPDVTGGGNRAQVRIVGAVGSGLPKRKINPEAGSVTQVLAFQFVGVAQRSPVGADGRFEVRIDRNRPCGLVFLDAADRVAGYLSLGSGVDSLPITRLDASLGELDLSTIDFVNGEGTPANNPIAPGGELELVGDELVAYRAQQALFSTIIRNMDMNGDGVLDVLSERPYWLAFRFVFRGPLVASSDPAGTAALPTVDSVGLLFSDYQPTVAQPPATLVLANGITVSNPQLGMRWAGHVDGRELPTYQFGVPGLAQADAGTYAISYDAGPRRLSFVLDSPIALDDYITGTDVWVSRPDAQRTTFHWRWSRLDGTPVEGAALLVNVVLQVDFDDGRPSSFANADPSATELTVPVDEASWAHVRGISLAVRDVFGNDLQTAYPTR